MEQKYFRLQFKIREDVLLKLDDSSDENINDLIRAAEQCIKKNPTYRDIIGALKQEVDRPKDLVNLMPKIHTST